MFAVVLESSFQNYNNSDNVSFLKCHIQIANSVAESIADFDTYNKVSNLLNDCKSDKKLIEILKVSGKGMSLTDNADSWTKHYYAYSFFVENAEILRKLIAEGKQKFNDEIKVLLFSDSFESKVKSLIEMYESIVELIRKFRQKDYSIADAVED